MCIRDSLLCHLNVLVERQGGTVDHNGAEAAVNAGLAGLEVRAVVQMERDGDLRALQHGGLDQLHQVGVAGVGAGALGHLEDNGGLFLAAGLGYTLTISILFTLKAPTAQPPL